MEVNFIITKVPAVFGQKDKTVDGQRGNVGKEINFDLANGGVDDRSIGLAWVNHPVGTFRESTKFINPNQ